jgi:uncharacterized protein YcfL
MRRIVILAVLLACAGCRTKQAMALHKVIVFDTTGCAFMLRANAGDTLYADRLVELDRPGCNAKRFEEVGR